MKGWKRWLTLLMASVIAVMLSSCALLDELVESSTASNATGQLQVIFLDVGQGDSILLISPQGRTMLVDAGDNDQEQRMVDYMKQYGISKIDVMVGTHPHADHIGGMDKVIDQVDVGAIYMPKYTATTRTYESLLKSIKNKNLKVITAKAGVTIDWDDQVQVDIIAPVKAYEDANNNSAVLRIAYGQHSFLLTGDAEGASEKDMLASGAELSATVLGVGHHGSYSSTSNAFLKKIAPEIAVIQSGKDNSYGHPHKVVTDRLKKGKVTILRNDLQGTVTFISNGKELQTQTER